MKASGAAERPQGSTKAAEEVLAEGKPVPGKVVPAKALPAAKSAGVKSASGTASPTKDTEAVAPAKPAGKKPATSAKSPADAKAAAAPVKTAIAKPVAPRADTPAMALPSKAIAKTASAHPDPAPAAPASRAAVETIAEKPAGTDSVIPAAAAVQPRAASKPQIETSHIVTAPTNDVEMPSPAGAAVTPAAAAILVTPPVAVRPAEVSSPRPAPIMVNGRPAPISRASNKDESFAEGDYVVYPTHGVGKVEKIAKEEIAGHHLELIHITFEENRMTLRVPVAKARSAGLRRLSTRKLFDEALAVLKGRARIKRTMWSRRAQEYEAKINSGDPISIAEVVRDLHRNSGQPDQSFSERQIYEAAMDRLAAELGALDQTDKNAALVKLGLFLKAL